MDLPFFTALSEVLPLRITALTPHGRHGLSLTYSDRTGCPRTLEIVRHGCGFTVYDGGSEVHHGETSPVALGARGWSDVVHSLRGLIEFPATDRMFWAIGEANLELAVEAMDDGADVQATNPRGLLPLDALAISLGCRADVIRLIFSRQAEARGDDERQLAEKLREMDELAMIRLVLVQAGAVDQSAFRDAVRTGDYLRAGAELEAGASIDAITLNRIPLLVERILHRDEMGVSWLIGRGAKTQWEPPVGEEPRPVFLFEAIPDLASRWTPGVILTPQTAAKLVGFAWPKNCDVPR